MTVGIAASCEGEDEPQVVVAADRMITSGRVTRVEYEHTKTKLNTIIDDPDASIEGVHCIALSAGAVSYADKFFTKLEEKLQDLDPAGVEHVASIGSEVLQEMGRERGNKQVLNQFGMDLSDIRGGDVDMSDDIITQLLSEVSEQHNHILENLSLIFAGVDHRGPAIYSIPDGNVAPHNQIGYHAIGSGAQPARSSFIRSRYDAGCELEECLLEVFEAKRQSEEAQGVGSRMDVSVISSSGGCYHLSNEEDIDDDSDGDSELEELKELYEQVNAAEESARTEALSSFEYTFEPSHEG